MQNLKEGQKVVITETSTPGTVVEITETTVTVVDENGNSHQLAHHSVAPQSFLTEIENDGKNLL